MPERLRLALPVVALIAGGCTVYVPLPSADEPPEAAVGTAVSSTAGAVSSASGPAGPTATATPTPDPTPAAFDLEVTGCNGGVLLDWTPLVDPAFHHYTALRSPIEEVDPAWPPIARPSTGAIRTSPTPS